MSFLENLKNEANYTYTENGALTHLSSNSAVLDFFSMGGALRTKKEKAINEMFLRAFIENPLLTLKTLFYLRDVRGGQGERRTFRIILNRLGKDYSEIVRKNLTCIPEYGRWDDLYCLINTPLRNDVLAFLKGQFEKDRKAEVPSLLAKWLKSTNTSSAESRRMGRVLAGAFGLTSKEYRKALAELREKIRIVERRMSAGEWKGINYSGVPSRAAMIYAKAFRRHDETGYAKFLAAVKKGDAKINTSTLFPYDIVNKILYRGQTDEAYDVLWDNLPDYIHAGENSLVVADVSGSMSGLPMAVSISLAIYMAERNSGRFHNHFMTFSANPQLQVVKGKNITEKVRYLQKADWGMNTNLQAVFNLVLNTALKHKTPQAELPAKLYIVSDMEFDMACGSNRMTNFEVIRAKYRQAGYKIPQLVFWNVNSRNTQSPITMDAKGVCLVSGCSPVIFEHLMKAETLTPVDMMLQVLNSPRYDRIVV